LRTPHRSSWTNASFHGTILEAFVALVLTF
jgi:hypothetical protein